MKAIIKALRTLDGWIAVVEKGLLVVGALGLTAAVLIGRFASSADAYEWAKILMIWTGLIAASLAAKNRKHIVVDLMGGRMPWRIRGALSLVSGLAATLLTLFLARVALLYVAGERARAIRSDVTVPFGDGKVEVWVFEVILVVGFAMLAWRFFLAWLEDFQALLEGDARHFMPHVEGLPPEGASSEKA
ncbi:MAG: TRAP transporter small permease subunit [Deltaproteobacteria bacterium]|nr:TRAP transporter small permease subunit [Deltaproteobacteria bacterium]